MNYEIFICTHNRKKELVECLESLKKYKKNLSVIDSSDKKASKKVINLCYKYYYKKDFKPLSDKRNFAIKKSNADVIIFTDDDCLAGKNWVENLIKEFKNEKIGCVTGRTLSIDKTKDSKYEKYFGFDKIGSEKKVIRGTFLLNPWRIGHGNNMAIRKKVFEKVDVFDEKLGVGTVGLAGEDTDFFYRVLKKGFWIIYNPDAIIYHNHLVKDEEIPKTAYRNGFASKKVLLKNLDFNTFIVYAALLGKYFLKFVLKRDETEKNRVRGLLGLKML